MSWEETLRNWTFFLHKNAYELKDNAKLQLKECEQNKEALRQRINVLEDQLDDLKYKYTKEKKSVPQTDLSQFKTRKTYKFNRTYKQLHQMLNIKSERDAVEDWVEENIDLSQLKGDDDEKAKQLRWLIDDVAKANKLYTKDPVPNTFTMPSDLIANDLKGNCNDWFLFIFYIYEVVFRENNKLYAVMGGLNLPEGWNQGNHAYCLWHHSDGKYYVVESAVGTTTPWSNYVSNAVDAFGSTDITKNFKYSRVVWMANTKNTYYQPVFTC